MLDDIIERGAVRPNLGLSPTAQAAVDRSLMFASEDTRPWVREVIATSDRASRQALEDAIDRTMRAERNRISARELSNDEERAVGRMMARNKADAERMRRTLGAMGMLTRQLGQYQRLLDIAGQVMQAQGRHRADAHVKLGFSWSQQCSPVATPDINYPEGPFFGGPGVSCDVGGQAGPYPETGAQSHMESYKTQGYIRQLQLWYVRPQVHHRYMWQWLYDAQVPLRPIAQPYNDEQWYNDARDGRRYLPERLPPVPQLQPERVLDPARPGPGVDETPPTIELPIRPQRPGAYVREKKLWIQGPLVKLIKRGANVATESMDFAECLWRAIPQKHRTQIRGHKAKQGGPTIYPPKGAKSAKRLYKTLGKAGAKRFMENDPEWQRYNALPPVHPSPQIVARELYANIGIDGRIDTLKAAKCIAMNHITDHVVGKIAGNANKGFLQGSGRTAPVGLGAGPAL